MILADTSIWIDYLRGSQPAMAPLLASGQIVVHPFVIAELALGSLKNRQQILAQLESLWPVPVAQLDEVRQLIETRDLYSRGLGLTDVHLLASCLLAPGLRLWTRDIRLDRVAASLAIAVQIP